MGLWHGAAPDRREPCKLAFDVQEPGRKRTTADHIVQGSEDLYAVTLLTGAAGLAALVIHFVMGQVLSTYMNKDQGRRALITVCLLVLFCCRSTCWQSVNKKGLP